MTVLDNSSGSAGVRRIRSGEIPRIDPVPWREQRKRRAPHRKAAAPAAVERADAPVLRLGRAVMSVDAIACFILLLCMLFIAQLGTRGAAVMAGLVPIYAYLRRRDLVGMISSRAYLLLFPALAICSTFWSEARGETLKYAIEMSITVFAAMLVASSPYRRQVVWAAALAFFTYAAAALVVGQRVGVGVGMGGDAFSGLTESKNMMADIAGTGALLSTAAALLAWRKRALVWSAGFTVAAAIEAYALVSARSAGALVAVCLTAVTLLTLYAVSLSSRAVRASFTAIVTLCTFIVALQYRTLVMGTIEFASRAFHKDPTLTGRTYLWYRARDVMDQAPILGIGYSAFWRQGNLDAEGLWRYAGIAERSGFNFHNTIIEVRVGLGWLGLALFLVTLVVGAYLLIRRYVTEASPTLVCWIALMLYEVSRMSIESLGVQQFYYTSFLLFVALGAGAAPLARRVARSTPVTLPSYLRLRPISYTGAEVRETLRIRG